VPLGGGYPNHEWTYDFLENANAKGRKLRFLPVVDEFTREMTRDLSQGDMARLRSDLSPIWVIDNYPILPLSYQGTT